MSQQTNDEVRSWFGVAVVTFFADAFLVIAVAHAASIDGLTWLVSASAGLVGTPLVGLLFVANRERRRIGLGIICGWLASLPLIYWWAGWLSDQIGG